MKKNTFRIGKKIAVILAGALLLSSFAGCGKKEETTSNEVDGVVNVRVSYWDYNIQGTLFDYSKEIGIWEQEFPADGDVKVTLIPFENGPTANESITAGELDFELSIGDQPFITGNANGVNTSILATTMKQEKTYIAVVAADSSINSYADLKGKNIAVGIGTFTHKSLIGVLNDNGISEEEVSFTNIGDAGYAEALTAIDRGELDAYFGSWANLAEAIEAGSVKQIGDSTGHPLTTYFVGTNKFIEKYPEVTEKLVKVLYETVAYINENPEEATKFFAAKLDWSEEVVATLIDKVDLVVDFTDADIASITETQNFLVSQEILDEEVEGLIEKHTNDSVIKKVKGE